MPIIIEVKLLTERYHAHEWGKAQFAMDKPEWPPSPWRLLRAMAAAWFGFDQSNNPNQFSQTFAHGVLEALGRSNVELWLPVTAFDELHFYQPLEGPTGRKLHHDLFAVPSGGHFYFAFQANLSGDQTELLNVLLSRLRYLGRAESRAALTVRKDLDHCPQGFFRVAKVETGREGDTAHEEGKLYPPETKESNHCGAPVDVLCPNPNDFQASDLWAIRAPANQGNGLPVHLVNALLAAKKPLPDGARLTVYLMPQRSVVHELPRPRGSSTHQPHLSRAGFSFRLCRRVPISIAETVAVARAYRDAACRAYRCMTGKDAPLVLSGRDANGEVDSEGRHLYYLPQLGESGQEIDHLVVRIPNGSELHENELDAMMSVLAIHLTPDGRYPIAVVAEGTTYQIGRRAKKWSSITPFVSPLRHRNRRHSTTLEQQVAACLRKSAGVTPSDVRAIAGPLGGIRTPVRVHEYAQALAASWRFTRRYGHWLSISFNEPVSLPVAVGADSHFGLGQFVPET